MRRIRLLFLLLLGMGIAIQFVRPPLDHPPVTADLQAPPEIHAILKRACYDCHSNETHLAWFDQPAPAYWLVVKDVREGRRVLNFSNWDSLSRGQQAAKLFESIMQIEQRGMPLRQYAVLHHGAVITTAELAVLKQYVGTLAYRASPDKARERAAAEQYALWTGPGGAEAEPRQEYNGITYPPLAEWPTWQAVSSTERYDNGTLRVIFGNEVAVKAIAGGHTNPYPDGTIFAKAAWDQVPDSPGEIHAGAFRQVEFMIRDSRKYRETFGWGWARWVGGLAMKPYGHDALFVTECMNCHRPLDKSDHTFTFPVSDTLRLAPLLDSLDGRPMRGAVITSSVNSRTATMSTLYGNGEAIGSARSGNPYKPGSVLTLVTWSQREDPHWFGGRIPRSIVSVARALYGIEGKVSYRYYEGPGLVLKEAPAGSFSYLTAKKASVLPNP